MARSPVANVVIAGAGAAGLMAARELARAGKRVSVLEARERCGGRIYPLPAGQFGYAAEGGAEFVHGAAPVTRALMHEAGLALLPRAGARWSARTDVLRPDEAPVPGERQFYETLAAVATDLPLAEFLDRHFAGRRFAALRQSVTRMVEGYDAADPRRISTFAIRDEWLARDEGEHGRIARGYGALINYLADDCRRLGATIRFGAVVSALDMTRDRVSLRCRSGGVVDADAAVLTLPLPLLAELDLPAQVLGRVAATAGAIGFGNVVKILLRFGTRWWADHGGHDLSDLSFLLSNAVVPTWWTQHPARHPVLTGWLAGPRAERVSTLAADLLVTTGLASLAEIFKRPQRHIAADLVAAQAIDWGRDPFARGAYSYATPTTREALSALQQPDDQAIFFAGEALYDGPDMGTVEAALASGAEAAQRILGAER
jgi:monoamine oxidase